MFEIQDDNGTIYSGKESEMTSKWEEITSDRTEEVDFTGDLRLIQVIDTWNG